MTLKRNIEENQD